MNHLKFKIMTLITLQQDGRDKIKITKSESAILESARRFFKWRKNISMTRIYNLGSRDYNNFIEYLNKQL